MRTALSSAVVRGDICFPFPPLLHVVRTRSDLSLLVGKLVGTMLAEWPGASYLTSLCYHCLICKGKMKLPTPQGSSEDRRQCLVWAWHGPDATFSTMSSLILGRGLPGTPEGPHIPLAVQRSSRCCHHPTTYTCTRIALRSRREDECGSGLISGPEQIVNTG